jgi:uncharacterized protein involved in response to NO
MRSLVHPTTDDTSQAIALFAKGFRPFFMIAAAFAAFTLPLFLLKFTGYLATQSYLVLTNWHAHEMIFGFTVAVLGGFLLTAVGNWTGRATAEGASLAVLVAVWTAGRIAMLAPDALPRYVPALLDLAFLPALIVACAIPLLQTKNRRNYGFLVLLGALWLANASIHAAALGLASASWQRDGNWIAVDLLVVALVVMTGRVVPMFTRNALHAEKVRGEPILERLTLISVVLLVALQLLKAPVWSTAAGAAAAGCLSLLRMRFWGTARTLREPLVWILHAGSIWIGLGFLLRSAASFFLVPLSSALHALTAGAIGALTLGMMARVALGHTGRPLTVQSPIVVAFGCVLIGGALRSAAPLLWPATVIPLVVAATLWSAGFLLYLVTYAPVLLAPRVDGRPG